MTTTQYVQLGPRNTPWTMYRAMVGLGLLCAILIVSVFYSTEPIIKNNKKVYLEQSIYTLFPNAKSIIPYQYSGIESDSEKFMQTPNQPDLANVYGVYNEQNTLLGFVIKAQGMGYQDLIVFLYGFIPNKEIVRGFKVLESRETPGLGTKIETDKNFLNNFEHLQAKLNPNKSQFLNSIEIVKTGEKQHPWQIDTITGATVSSEAVGVIIQKSTRHWIPKLMQQLSQSPRDFELDEVMSSEAPDVKD